jgi:hypothetical protein
MVVENHPRGYPRLAAFLDSDIDGRIYRRFGYLRNYLLLHRQDEISALEEEMNALDKQHERDDPYRLCSRRYEEEDLQNMQRKRTNVTLEWNVEGIRRTALARRRHHVLKATIAKSAQKLFRLYLERKATL